MNDVVWTTVRFGDLAADTRNAIVGGPFGSYLVSGDYTDAGVPVIRGQNMGDGRWVSGPFAFVSEEKAESLRANLARPGDIVFTQRGTLGQVALVPDVPWDRYVVSQSQMKATVNPDLADPLFLYYYFTNPAEQHYIIANAIQTGVPHSNLGQLRAHPMRVPSRPKQCAIADVLGALDDKIEQNRRTARALERLARAVFRAWFVEFEPVKSKAAGATAFPSMPQNVFDALPTRFVDSAIGPVPKGWELASVYDFAEITYGAPFSSKLFNDEGEGRPLIRIRDLQTHEPTTFTTEQHPRGVLVRPTDIVVGMDGEFRLHYWLGPDAWLNQRLCRVEARAGVPRMFLGESLRAPLEYFERAKTGTTVIHLGKADIDTFRLLRPATPVLCAFGDVTDSLLELFVHAARESRSLAAMRDYLLPKLLSGQVRVEAAHG